MAGILDLAQKYLVGGEGPSPSQLYAEAAPAVQVALKQYDKASPGIDWVIDNWVLTTGIIVGLIAIGTIGGNYFYDYIKKK
jgi:hypothetical protein